MQGTDEAVAGTLGELLPGMAELPGVPNYPMIAGPLCAYLNKRSSLTWRGLAALTVSEIAEIPHMGPIRTKKTIEAIGERLSIDRGDLRQRLDRAEAQATSSDPLADVPIGRLLPGLAGLSDGPTQALVGTPVMRFLRAGGDVSWQAVARITVGQLTNLPGIGPIRSKQILSNLSNAVGADLERQKELAAAGTSSAKQAIGELIEEIATWAVANGHEGSVLDAVRLAAESEAADVPRAELRWLELIPASELASRERLVKYDPVAAVTRLLDGFDGRELAIVDRIVNLDGTAETLEQIGNAHGVTRERIRQLEAKIKEQLAVIGLEASYRSIAAETDRIRARLGALAPVARLAGSANAALDDRTTRLFLYLAGPYGLDGDWLVLDSIGDRHSLLLTAFDDVQEAGIAPLAALVDRLLESGVGEDVAQLLIEEDPRLRTFDDRVVDWKGSLADKAELVLTLTGQPMTLEELAEIVEPNSTRSMAAQIQTGSRFVRVGLRRYAMAAWDMDQFVGIVPTMVERLANGPRPVEALAQELADEYGVSPNSIKIHAGTHPGFISEGGRVSLRPALQPYRPKTNLEESRHCYVVDGLWSWRVPVDHDVLRGAGRALPEAFAVHLGAAPLSKGSIDSPVGPIALGWGQFPHIGSLRAAARSLDAEEGDWMFIRRVRPSAIDVVLLRTAELPQDPDLRLRALLGAGDSEAPLEQVIADALGLAGTIDHDLAEERALLKARREPMLLELLDAIEADQDR